MTTQRDTTAPSADAHSPAAHQAFLLLRTVFTVVPILFGLDKALTCAAVSPQPRSGPPAPIRRRPAVLLADGTTLAPT